MNLFGELSLAAIPLDQPVIMIVLGVLGTALLGLLAYIAHNKLWGYLWREWITSTDHKRIGIMSILLALVMFVLGFSDAIMMRSQQTVAGPGHAGFLPPEYSDQVFTAYGTIMIFFMTMPFVTGLMNHIVSLQLGARDVAFPVLNSISFRLTAAGALLPNIALVLGQFARAGCLDYPPLSELATSPGVGVDYYLWALEIVGVGLLLSGISLVATIPKKRAPIFCWTSLASNMPIFSAFPILTATFGMLLCDRYLGFQFFTNESGDNATMYMNLIWAWGHSKV